MGFYLCTCEDLFQLLRYSLSYNEVYKSSQFQFWSSIPAFELLIPRVTFAQFALGQIELMLGFMGVRISHSRNVGAL
jgi:hypothetical protein